MGICVETGELRRPPNRPDVDYGKFTVESADVPLGTLRKKGFKHGGNGKDRRKNVRLTPISEGQEEPIGRELSFVSVNRNDGMTPFKSDVGTSTDSVALSLSSENSFERSDTPINRKSYTKLLLDTREPVEDELQLICEESGSSTKSQEVFNILTELPPRPKGRRKMLPPSVTSSDIGDKLREKKLLKLRKRIESRLQSQSLSVSPAKSPPFSPRTDCVSPLKDIRGKYPRLSDISTPEKRPKSAESGVQVIRLSDLASCNSTSVPDLPSILSKLTDGGDSKFTKRTSLDFDDNGALSTPRQAPEQSDTISGWDKNCLKGSDMSSFYNMWERDRNKRPFGKKSKQPVLIHRSCLCSIKKSDDRLSNAKSKCLPPIPPAHG